MEYAVLAQDFVNKNNDVLLKFDVQNGVMTFHAHNGLMCPFRLPVEACNIIEEFFEPALYVLTRNV